MTGVALSRSELMTLIFDKLETIRAEAEEIDGEKKLTEIRPRVARIASEARRIQRLIDEHERVALVGHCVHCGKPFLEHEDKMASELPPEARVGKRGSTELPPRCLYLRGLFESLELATYQPLPGMIDP